MKTKRNYKGTLCLELEARTNIYFFYTLCRVVLNQILKTSSITVWLCNKNTKYENEFHSQW